MFSVFVENRCLQISFWCNTSLGIIIQSNVIAKHGIKTKLNLEVCFQMKIISLKVLVYFHDKALLGWVQRVQKLPEYQLCFSFQCQSGNFWCFRIRTTTAAFQIICATYLIVGFYKLEARAHRNYCQHTWIRYTIGIHGRLDIIRNTLLTNSSSKTFRRWCIWIS